jgi:hypothetical protein
MRTSIEIPDQLWSSFEKKAMAKYGRYGSIKRAIADAIQEWLKE